MLFEAKDISEAAGVHTAKVTPMLFRTLPLHAEACLTNILERYFYTVAAILQHLEHSFKFYKKITKIGGPAHK